LTTAPGVRPARDGGERPACGSSQRPAGVRACELVAGSGLPWLWWPGRPCEGWLRLVLNGLAAALPLPSASVAGWRHHGGGVWGGWTFSRRHGGASGGASVPCW
jgi:hypothetical protein